MGDWTVAKGRGEMASGRYVVCPKCAGRFFVGEEFFRLPEARCYCPYCAHEFAARAPAGVPPPARQPTTLDASA